jgi:hypothetical protein
MPPGKNYLSENKGGSKYCETVDDIPKAEHFAILEFSSINIPGDERSRTHPGHGYPTTTERVVRYLCFTNQAEWEAVIRSRVEAGNKNFLAIKVNPANLELNVKVNIKIT